MTPSGFSFLGLEKQFIEKPQQTKKVFNKIMTKYLKINGRYMQSNQSEENH